MLHCTIVTMPFRVTCTLLEQTIVKSESLKGVLRVNQHTHAHTHTHTHIAILPVCIGKGWRYIMYSNNCLSVNDNLLRVQLE